MGLAVGEVVGKFVGDLVVQTRSENSVGGVSTLPDPHWVRGLHTFWFTNTQEVDFDDPPFSAGTVIDLVFLFRPAPQDLLHDPHGDQSDCTMSTGHWNVLQAVSLTRSEGHS